MPAAHNPDTREKLPICERLRAIESASPDFLGVNDGGCHTCFHRNPDGPEAADTIEALVEAVEKCRDFLIHETGFEDDDEPIKSLLAALSRARNGGQP